MEGIFLTHSNHLPPSTGNKPPVPPPHPLQEPRTKDAYKATIDMMREELSKAKVPAKMQAA